MMKNWNCRQLVALAAVMLAMGAVAFGCMGPPPPGSGSGGSNGDNNGENSQTANDSDNNEVENAVEAEGVQLSTAQSWYEYTEDYGDIVVVVPVTLQNVDAGSAVPAGWEQYQVVTADAHVFGASSHSTSLEPSCPDDYLLDQGGVADCRIAFDVGEETSQTLRYTGLDDDLEVDIVEPSGDVYGPNDPDSPGSSDNGDDNVAENDDDNDHNTTNADDNDEEPPFICGQSSADECVCELAIDYCEETLFDEEYADVHDCSENVEDDFDEELQQEFPSCTETQRQEILDDFFDCLLDSSCEELEYYSPCALELYDEASQC